MVQSKLNDEEMNTVLSLSAAGNHMSLVKYVNQLLYHKGLGDDTCARPLAFRTSAEQEQPCFAIGYLDKIQSFLAETAVRSPKTVVSETTKFITDLKKEIDQFFSKKEG